jgi:hypothetical protein
MSKIRNQDGMGGYHQYGVERRAQHATLAGGTKG